MWVNLKGGPTQRVGSFCLLEEIFNLSIDKTIKFSYDGIIKK